MGIYTFILIILYCYASVKWVMLFPVSPTPATCFLLYTFKETWYLYGIILHFIKHLLPLLALKKKRTKLNERFVKACLIFGTKIPAFVTRTIENCIVRHVCSNSFLCYKYAFRNIKCIYDRAIGQLFIN